MPQRQAPATPHRKLNDAFRDYMAEKPWVPLKDHHVLVLTHPADGTPFYAIAMGDGGQEYGVSLYMGKNAFDDLASLITGVQQHNVHAPMLGAMAKYPPDHPLGNPPTLVYHRVNPINTEVSHIMNTMFAPQPQVTPPDKEALAHAFQAATHLARTAGHPDSPVKPRNNPHALHMITATLQDNNWRYKLETGGIRIREQTTSPMDQHTCT